jgi:hypothetical protein
VPAPPTAAPPMAAPPSLRPLVIPVWITDIKDQVFHTLHHGIMTKFYAGDLDSAFADAETLLLVYLCSQQ